MSPASSARSSHPDQPPSPAKHDRAPDSADYLGPLLHALAESLDVREIFARISAEARRIVPHDFLMLCLLSEDHERVRVIALSGDLGDIPADMAIPDSLRLPIEKGAFVMSDVRAQPGGKGFTGLPAPRRRRTTRRIEIESRPLYHQVVVVQGMRSFLRVAVRLDVKVWARPSP